MMMMRTAMATDLNSLVSMAMRAADSEKDSGVERCSDIVRYLQSLSLSSKDIRELSREMHPLENLRNHGNPKIRIGVQALYNSWMKTLYSSGREAPTKKLIPLNPKKRDYLTSALTKNQHHKSQVLDIATKTKIKTGILGLKKNEGQRFQAHEARETKQNLKKKPLKLSENPRFGTHKTGEQNLNGVCKSVPRTSRPVQMKNQTGLKISANPKKNDMEMLELFEIAKKSADKANAKGLLLSQVETSICVDTLSLLIGFPIRAASPETKRIMERLANLTRHRDRKIANSASTLLHHWRQNIIKESA